MAYAKGTEVSVEKSMAQVRQVLFKNGAEGLAVIESKEACAIKFLYEGTPYKFTIYFPTMNENQVLFDKGNRKRTIKQSENFIENERKRLWRAMLLYITASIEAHNNGLADLKSSFMANIITKDGSTLYEKLGSDIGRAIDNPKFLLG